MSLSLGLPPSVEFCEFRSIPRVVVAGAMVKKTSPIAAEDLKSEYSTRWQSERSTGQIGDDGITAMQSRKLTGSTGYSLEEKSR